MFFLSLPKSKGKVRKEIFVFFIDLKLPALPNGEVKCSILHVKLLHDI